MFFVEAFRTTGDERWLSAAREGMRWMSAHLDAAAKEWAGCGLLTGIGGWAVVLNELAEATGDEQPRNEARRVLETVADHATVTGDGDGVHWHDLTEMVWGTAGIGCLMLTLGAGYVARCCGSAGVAEFFLDLHRLEGDPGDLAFAVTLVDDLLNRAIHDDVGMRWSNYEFRLPQPDLPPETTYLQGAPGIGSTLLRLHRHLAGDPWTVRWPHAPSWTAPPE
jgi:hypothetical protein